MPVWFVVLTGYFDVTKAFYWCAVINYQFFVDKLFFYVWETICVQFFCEHSTKCRNWWGARSVWQTYWCPVFCFTICVAFLSECWTSFTVKSMAFTTFETIIWHSRTCWCSYGLYISIIHIIIIHYSPQLFYVKASYVLPLITVSSRVSVLSLLSNSFWKATMGVLAIISSIICCCCSCSVHEYLWVIRLHLLTKSSNDSSASCFWVINCKRFILKFSLGSGCSMNLSKIISVVRFFLRL